MVEVVLKKEVYNLHEYPGDDVPMAHEQTVQTAQETPNTPKERSKTLKIGPKRPQEMPRRSNKHPRGLRHAAKEARIGNVYSFSKGFICCRVSASLTLEGG